MGVSIDTTMDTRRTQHRLTDPEIAGLRIFLDTRGHAAACEAIGIVRTTAYRAMSHDTVARGTAVLIRGALALAAQQERQP